MRTRESLVLLGSLWEDSEGQFLSKAKNYEKWRSNGGEGYRKGKKQEVKLSNVCPGHEHKKEGQRIFAGLPLSSFSVALQYLVSDRQ